MKSILAEHEAPEEVNTVGPAQYQPTDEERKALKLVEKLFDKAKKHKAIYDEKWVNYYHMFRGKQWKEARPSYRHSEVVNMIFQTIQSTVPIQTDQRPRFTFLPQEPTDRDFADILNEVAEADWIRNNWSEQLTEVIYDSNFYGTGMSKLYYDPDALMGMGDIVYESVDPFYSFPDPSSTDVNKKSRYFIEAEPMDVEEIKRRYPHMKDYIKPDLIDMLSSSKNDLSPFRFKSPVDIKVTMEGGNPQELTYKDKALLVCAYLKSDEYEEFQTEEGYEQRLKYPNGRKIVVCNGVVLEDGPNPYDDGLFPFQRLINYTLPREFWGISEVEQLEGPQKTFNKLISFALDVLTLMGNPIWVVDSNSDVDTDHLTNRPGLIVEKNPGSTVTRVEGVQLQPYVLQLANSMREWFNEISGSQDVTRGVQPTGITAASAISSLQDAAQTRLRQKARHLDATLQSLGQQYVSRVFQFYDAPRIFRITNKEGVDRYFKMHIEKAKEGQDYKYKAVVEQEGEHREYFIKGEFDVRVATGSTLPFAKAEKEQRLLNLFDRGILDAEEVLKGIDYPNWEAILQRIEDKKMAEAQAQAQAAPPPQA